MHYYIRYKRSSYVSSDLINLAFSASRSCPITSLKAAIAYVHQSKRHAYSVRTAKGIMRLSKYLKALRIIVEEQLARVRRIVITLKLLEKDYLAPVKIK